MRWLKLLALFGAILVIGLTVTAVSWVVITGKNVALDPDYEFTAWNGREIVGYGCDGTTVQPVTRGLPMTYSFYNHCIGTTVQLAPFVVNWLFWSIIISIVLFFIYRKKKVPRRS
jgi:hypothetical protein